MRSSPRSRERAGRKRRGSPDAHIVMVLDDVGRHQSKDFAVRDNITLVVLPPYSPELNPVERVWL